MKSNFLTSLKHGVVTVILFGAPLLLAHLGNAADLTIGGTLTLLYHWATLSTV